MLQQGQFDRRVGAVASVALLVLVVFFGALAYWQVWRTDLATDEHNPRVLSSFTDPNRGRILDRDGNVLAQSLADGTRVYTDASVAHAIGYLSAQFGSQGAELEFNDYLEGSAGNSWEGALNAEFRRAATQGQDVRLTIDPQIQAAAAQALGARRGAVIALDPRNGEVLAMVSVPTYDPGTLTDAVVNDESSPLLNRAAQGLYPPGSTFKTVTTISALENGVIKPDTPVECVEGQMVFDGFPVSCRNVPQGEGRYPFKNAFTFSVNAILAQVGVELGWDRLLETARKLGFESEIPFTTDTVASQVLSPGSEKTISLLASTAFGQGELLATPLQMALVAAAIANDGVMADPHLGLAAYDGDHRLGDVESPGRRRVMSSEVAATMREFMVSVVDNAQANGVQIPGVKVGGKTGTAETGQGTSHAWFIAFAPADRPTIAVAVVVENGGRGGEVASPIAGQVIRAALNR
ncbi:MAG TPA: penicillin-binding protein 2 [Tepidiformaceae bacterium]|nr:penicillin-binding protein 2 [Tepidiformaceae bacterium]